MPRLSSPEQDLLLAIVRDAVRTHLSGDPPERPVIPRGALCDPSGVFISIHHGPRLRGCIGRTESHDPLYRTAAECAVSAAVSDPRFEPLEIDELNGVSFQVSVLSAPQPIDEPARIEVGRHGLLVEMHGRRGLLLPQVASDLGWNRTEFLRQTCMKAGLEPDSWRQGARLFAFEAEVFGENPHRQ